VKEALHILRDPRSLGAAILLPVIMLVLFGYAISLDVRSVDVAVIDRDRSPESRALIEGITADGSIRVVGRPTDEAELDRLLDRGRIRLGLIVPIGYGARLEAGRDAPVQILVDGAEATYAGLAAGYVTGSILDQSRRALADTLRQHGLPERLPGLRAQPRVFFNEALDSRWFVVPGLIAIIIMQLSALLTSQCVAREYERNTIEQILVSPVSGPALILGKLSPYLIIGAVQVGLVVALSYFVFGVPIRGSFLLLGLCTALFLAGSMALGLTLSSALKSQALAMQVSLVATTLPSLILSGFMFPIENMPVWLQPVSYVVPARYYVSITRGLFLKGVGMETLWPDALAMLIYATVLTVVAIRGFKGRLA
jgi:ABC-2 type transport system permease protein